MASAASKQDNWRRCSNCKGLVFFGNAVCGRAGVHHPGTKDPTYSYFLKENNGPGQDNWKHCSKCQVLSWAEVTVGPCPRGGKHDVEGSSNYHLAIDNENAKGQRGWRWCRKCQSLNRPGKRGYHRCMVTGWDHETDGSGNYTLATSNDGEPNTQKDWYCCDKCEILCYAGWSACVKGGTHLSISGGAYYSLLVDQDNVPGGQNDWKLCNKCCGLAYTGLQSKGICARGPEHDFSGSGNYTVRFAPQGKFTEDQWKWCSKCQLLWWSGQGDQPCPSGTNHDESGSANYAIDSDIP